MAVVKGPGAVAHGVVEERRSTRTTAVAVVKGLGRDVDGVGVVDRSTRTTAVAVVKGIQYRRGVIAPREAAQRGPRPWPW